MTPLLNARARITLACLVLVGLLLGVGVLPALPWVAS